MLRLARLVGIALVALSLTGCILGTRRTLLEPISCSAFEQAPAQTRTVILRRGESLVVTLCANPSTGFSWQKAQITDPGVIQQVERETRTGEQAKGLVGYPGAEVVTLKASEPGHTTLSLDYSRPWEGGEKGVWKVTLDVTVE